MEIPLGDADKTSFFEFPTYEEFSKERQKLNFEHTLKLWYSLPAGLPDAVEGYLYRYTPQQQRTAFRKIKIYYLYTKVFKRTCIRKKVYSKGKK